jgi:hypothetical protein
MTAASNSRSRKLLRDFTSSFDASRERERERDTRDAAEL